MKVLKVAECEWRRFVEILLLSVEKKAKKGFVLCD